jgi:hypothetical protein
MAEVLRWRCYAAVRFGSDEYARASLPRYPSFLGPQRDDVIIVEAPNNIAAEDAAEKGGSWRGKIIYDPAFAKRLRRKGALAITGTTRRYPRPPRITSWSPGS